MRKVTGLPVEKYAKFTGSAICKLYIYLKGISKNSIEYFMLSFLVYRNLKIAILVFCEKFI